MIAWSWVVTSMGFPRQIQLLLWKNWTLRKRQKVTAGSGWRWGVRRKKGGGAEILLPFSSVAAFGCSVSLSHQVPSRRMACFSWP